ncbi:MAG: efflux RND transporter permease subunit [Candidatus Eisenbacteria sp.]|nr:efflux RND transporter permease subunit [Candidatus Eisenbacteria bacterium]
MTDREPPRETLPPGPTPASAPSPGGSWIDAVLRFCLDRKLVVFLLALIALVWGLIVAPFDWTLGGLARSPVPVDAIPDIGENQQVVFTEWVGRSPQDVEDQVTYPLTAALLGVPGVRTIRSHSMLGVSSIYVILDESVDFYWSRSRILERLNSLSPGALPPGIQPRLGPDATALGQVFWYTLEGRDPQGRPTGGWGLEELRSTQDWYVRFALMSAEGVSEVASVGGFVREYQIDVDPDAMRAHGVSLDEVFTAVRLSNVDVGARTIEINRAEYVIRGLGLVRNLAGLEQAVVKVREHVPIFVGNVAHVSLGPGTRRGALDKGGAEAVGGVVVVRYGENPLAVIKNVKAKIAEISAGLPRKTLPDGTLSQVQIIPFYDRSGLIHETLGTLKTALTQEILVTIIVVLLMVMHLGSSLLISGLLPLAVLLCFVAMKSFGVDANVVALSGIAIAIGTMVDMGVIITENIVRHARTAHPGVPSREIVLRATREVGGAAVTAVATTVVSFLPVFTMQGAEGKLFRPLAFTKTFALAASVIVALTLIPPLSQFLIVRRRRAAQASAGTGPPGAAEPNSMRAAGPNPKHTAAGAGWTLAALLGALGLAALFLLPWWIGGLLLLIGAAHLLRPGIARWGVPPLPWLPNALVALFFGVLLAGYWMPLGPEQGPLGNLLFVGLLLGGLLLFFFVLRRLYVPLLRWFLAHKALFLLLPLTLVLSGAMIWLGFERLGGWLPASIRSWRPVVAVAHAFPGLGREFMPPLDEGSFLYMPTTMPHASIGEALDVLQKQDLALEQIPEVELAVGKIGRAETALDPAPISMIETVISYRSEFDAHSSGRLRRYRFESGETDTFRTLAGVPVRAPDGEPYVVAGRFARDEEGRLIPDSGGSPFRLWRPPLDPALNPARAAWEGIRSPDDIWDAIVRAAQIPGTTSAPKLQPIRTRLVMLQSGMRAPMGVKVRGPDLVTIEKWS